MHYFDFVFLIGVIENTNIGTYCSESEINFSRQVLIICYSKNVSNMSYVSQVNELYILCLNKFW
jgi:hypothetical protein